MALLLAGMLLGPVGCGGGGGDAPALIPNTPQGMTTVEGVAAAGAPIVGTINVRGANGLVSLGAIEADGHFTVDVSALAAPFTIWAQGSANGKEVTLYSTIDDPGRVNVTPATHAIMAMALDQDPVDYFGANPDAALPSAAAIAEAKAAILSILDTVFQAVGMPAGFDLMNGEFTADGAGFDAVLDAVDMSVGHGALTIVDRISNSTLAQGALDGELVQLMTDEAIASTISGSMTDLDRMRDIFETVADLYADAQNPPSRDVLNAQVLPLMADDFLDSGSGPADELAAWADPANEKGPPGPFTVESIAIHRQMATYTVAGLSMSENGSHEQGVWAVVRIRIGQQVEQMLTSFVRDAGSQEWLWFGDQNPFLDAGSVDAYGMKAVHGNGAPQYDSGLDFWLDDEGNQALSLFGISVVGIMNSALPQINVPTDAGFYTFNGLVMARPDVIATEYQIVYPIDTYNGPLYMESNGLDIRSITDSEFLFVGINSNGTPTHIWIKLLQGRPIATSELAAHPERYFATITGIAGKAPSAAFTAADFSGGATNVTWQLPVNEAIGLRLDYATLGWWKDGNWAHIDDEDGLSPTATSYDFPTSGLIGLLPPESGWVNVGTEDMFDRDFDASWDFTVQPES